MKVTEITPAPMPGVVIRYHLADDRIIDILTMTYGKMRIGIGPADVGGYDNAW